MNKGEAFEVIWKQLCKEVDMLAEQIQKNNSMSVQDLEKLDKIFHTKKNMLKSREMEGGMEYLDEGMSGNNQNGNGMSGYRGRAMNGRFVSREAGNSYSDGYSRGYSEAMNHFPYYDEPRRW